MKSQTAGGGGAAAAAAATAVTEVSASNKKEKSAPQATAEQLRIAEITNISNERDIADLNENIRTIVELTHRTPDEAAMALHDSNGSVEDAINILLEGSPDDNGWETTGKKKKEKQSVAEVRSKEDNRKSNDDRAGGRGKGRGGGRTAVGAPQTGGRGRQRGGPRSRTGGRDSQPGIGKKNRGDAGDENSSHWNNGTTTNEFDEDFKSQQKDTNDQQQNDTIKNMGNWDDFNKADQKVPNDWGAKKERQSDWVDASGSGERNNREWKSRHRHQSQSNQGQGGKSGSNQPLAPSNKGTSQQQQQQPHHTQQQQQQPQHQHQVQSNLTRINNSSSSSNSNNPNENLEQVKIVDGTKLVQQNAPSHLHSQGAQQRLVRGIQQAASQQGLAPKTKVRLPPASKIPQTPVEMPPDHLDLHGNSLDVSFGVLTFGSNSFEPISPMSHNQQLNKVEHNGSGLTAGGNLAAHGAQTTASNVAPLKLQGGQIVIDVSAKSLQQGSQQPVERDRSQVSQQVTSIAGPPGLDKSSVGTVAPLQTHKPSISGSTQSQQAAVPSSYHSQAQQQQQSQVSSGSSGASSNYQQYSANTAYKQAPNSMPYLHNLSGIYNAAHSNAQYSQPASQPYGSANYSTAFGGSTVASGGYKGKDGASVGSTAGSAVSVSDTVSSSATSQYDGKKTSQLQQQVQQQQQQQQQQTMQPGGLVLQPGQLHGPHMHAATPYAHITGHPGTMQPLYPFYPHHVTASGTHLATDYQQQQRENSSSATSAGISTSSLLQQHSYDKFVRSQDDSSTASASQVSSTGGSQSTITATAAYPQMSPYNYYGVHMVAQGTYQPMPFMSAQVAGYPPAGTASSASQASKTTSGYGTASTAFDYQLSSHLSSTGGDYNKYQPNKMMSNTPKYISAAAAADRR